MHEKFVYLLRSHCVIDVNVSLDNNAGSSTLCPENITGKFAKLKHVYSKPALDTELSLIILESRRVSSALPKDLLQKNLVEWIRFVGYK